jgi:Zn-dependent protease with chaperone function
MKKSGTTACRCLHGAAILTVAIACAACTPPATQMGQIAPEQLQEEQLKQQQLVISSEIAAHQRLTNVAYPMLKAAIPICGKWIATRTGIVALNAYVYSKEYQPAARALGYGDTLTVVTVTKGSTADGAGLKVGDKVVGVRGAPAPTGKSAVRDFMKSITPEPATRGDPPLAATATELAVLRAADSTGAARQLTVSIAPDTVCSYVPVAAKSDVLNAWADGHQITVTTAMMRFAGSDDELAVVVSHELAHNAMRHMDAKKKNATFGAILGAALDVAAATQGVNTGGGFTRSGAEVGASSYSQDFEREADYVGMYILARAGRPYADAPNFWRRMGQESPGSIKYASTHPTSAERFIRLDKTVTEIQAKVASGAPLLPEAKAPGTQVPDSSKSKP